jgi:hypothetical protein
VPNRRGRPVRGVALTFRFTQTVRSAALANAAMMRTPSSFVKNADVCGRT